ncbi:MAG: hypothetical protein DDT26_01735 [Dehalococcoidia bacterium]|nr:hypothetical protein [Chloroflexota bacterium]
MIGKLVIYFITAAILVVIFVRGENYLGVLLSICFIPLIYRQLRTPDNQSIATIKDWVKVHRDFFFLLLIFFLWLIGTSIEQRFFHSS